MWELVVPIQSLRNAIHFIAKEVIRPSSKSSSSRMRNRHPSTSMISPSAVPVCGLSDQTATVDRSTSGRSRCGRRENGCTQRAIREAGWISSVRRLDSQGLRDRILV